jgi:hypothetical protein
VAFKFNSIVEAVNECMDEADTGITIASAVQNAAVEGDYGIAILEGLEVLVGMAELAGKEIGKKAPVLSLAVTGEIGSDSNGTYLSATF